MRFAMDYPEDYEDRLDAMLEAADFARKEAKENPSDQQATINETDQGVRKDA